MEGILLSGTLLGAVVYFVYYMLNRHKKCGCGTCVCSGEFKR